MSLWRSIENLSSHPVSFHGPELAFSLTSRQHSMHSKSCLLLWRAYKLRELQVIGSKLLEFRNATFSNGKTHPASFPLLVSSQKRHIVRKNLCEAKNAPSRKYSTVYGERMISIAICLLTHLGRHRWPNVPHNIVGRILARVTHSWWCRSGEALNYHAHFMSSLGTICSPTLCMGVYCICA